MKALKIACAAVLTAVLAAPALAHAHEDEVKVDRTEMLRTIRILDDDLDAMEEHAGRDSRQHQRIDDMRRAIASLREQLDVEGGRHGGDHDGDGDGDSDDHGGGDVAQPLSADDFAAVLSEIQGDSVGEEVGTCRRVARDAWFTSDQVVDVVHAVAASSEADCAIALYPRTVDRIHWGKVYQALGATAEKKVRAALGDQ